MKWNVIVILLNFSASPTPTGLANVVRRARNLPSKSMADVSCLQTFVRSTGSLGAYQSGGKPLQRCPAKVHQSQSLSLPLHTVESEVIDFFFLIFVQTFDEADWNVWLIIDFGYSFIRQSSSWWTREKVGEYFPIFSRDHPPLIEYLTKMKIIQEKPLDHSVNPTLKLILNSVRSVIGKVEPSLLLWSVFTAGCAIIMSGYNRVKH